MSKGNEGTPYLNKDAQMNEEDRDQRSEKNNSAFYDHQ